MHVEVVGDANGLVIIAPESGQPVVSLQRGRDATVYGTGTNDPADILTVTTVIRDGLNVRRQTTMTSLFVCSARGE